MGGTPRGFLDPDEEEARRLLGEEEPVDPSLGLEEAPAYRPAGLAAPSIFAPPAPPPPPAPVAPPNPNEPGPIRQAWDTVTAPVKAAVGLTGTSLVHAFGLDREFPEAYQRAHARRAAEVTHGVDRPLSTLEEAEAMPGMGDLAAEGISPSVADSFLGRMLGPLGRLAGNIAGDPTTWGPGLILKATKVGQAGRALGTAMETVDTLARAGQVGEAAIPATAEVGRASSALDAALAAESPTVRRIREVAEAASGGHGQLAETLKNPTATRILGTGLGLPVSPIAGVAYAPDIIQSTYEQGANTVDALRAGRYADALSSGAGALLTAGMGRMVARGVISEAEAAGIMERAAGRATGETAPSERMREAAAATGAKQQAQAAEAQEAATVQAQTPQAATPGATVPTPGPAPPTPAEVPAAGGPAPVGAESAPQIVNIPATPVAPTPPEPVAVPGAAKVKVQRGDQVVKALTDIVNERAQAGGLLTKRDLIDAGLVTARQAKSYNLETLVDALGGTHLKPMMTAETGLGYRVKSQLPAAEVTEVPTTPPPPPAPVAPNVNGALPGVAEAPGATLPAESVSAPAASPVPTQAQPEASGGVSAASSTSTAPAAPGPTKLTRAEIQRQLDTHPELKPSTMGVLQGIADRNQIAVEDIPKHYLNELLPGDEHKPARAVLNHVLAQVKAEAKRKAPTVASPEAVQELQPPESRPSKEIPVPTSAITSPVDVTAEALVRATSGRQSRGDVGIGEGYSPVRIANREQLARAEQEFEQIQPLLGKLPDGHPLARRADDLEEGIADAYAHGIHTAHEAPPLVHAPLPELAGVAEATAQEKPEPTMVGTPITERTRPRQAYENPQAQPAIPPREPQGELAAARESTAGMVRRTGAQPELLNQRSHDLFGHGLDDATPEELNSLQSYADLHPRDFGIPEPDRDPAVISRLVGGTEHLATKDWNKAIREFRYDPTSPAGRAQQIAQQLESRYGLPAEENLQDAILRWTDTVHPENMARLRENAAHWLNLPEDTTLTPEAEKARARDVKKYESALNLKRLLVDEPDAAKARGELFGLMKRELTNRAKNYAKREGGIRPIDNFIGKAAANNLTPAERVRFAVEETPDLPASDEGGGEARKAVDAASVAASTPKKPADMNTADWLKKVWSTPDLLQELRQSTADLYKISVERGGGRTGRGGAPEVLPLKAIADDLGVSYEKLPTPKLVNRIARRLSGQAETVSNLLNDDYVQGKAPEWSDMTLDAPKVGDSNARVVDFEGHAPALVDPLTKVAPLADQLSRLTSEISASTNMPTRFGGLTPSPEMKGLRLGDDIYVNPLHAIQDVKDSLAGSSMTGQKLQDAINYKAAQSMVDTTIHEIAHTAARHEAATGDLSFTDAYSKAVRDLGPRYAEMIRETQGALADSMPQLEVAGDSYRSAFNEVKKNAESGIRAEGLDAGAGEGGAPTVEGGPGRSEGSAAGSSVNGTRPIRPIPPGREGAGRGEAGVGAGAAAGEGAAGGAGGAEHAGTPRGGADASVSLTKPINDLLQKSRIARTQATIGRDYIHNLSQLTGGNDPAAVRAAGEEYLARVKEVMALPPEEQAKLINAAPGGEKDIGLRLNKYLADSMSDEQKAATAIGLLERNALYPRSKPMTFDKMDADARALLDIHTPEEFVVKGLKNGLKTEADFTLARTVIGTYGADVDSAMGKLRAAEIAQDPDAIARATDEVGLANLRKRAAIDALMPETTRVARILGAQRQFLNSLSPDETFRSRFMGAMRASKINQAKAAELYQMFTDVAKAGPAGDWDRFTNAFRDATKVSNFDKWLEFWKAGLLGWPTQIANIGSNALFRLNRDAEQAVSVLANNFYTGLTGKPKTRFIGEIAARNGATKQAIWEGWQNLKSDLLSAGKLEMPDIGRRLREGSFYDEPNLPQLTGAIGGKTGEFIRIPFKMLDAFDNFFKHIARTQEYATQAFRLANDVGNRVGGEATDHASARIFQEIRTAAQAPISNYKLFKKYKDAIDAGNMTARADTFQTALSPTMQKIYKATQAHPSIQLLVPFFKTPYNILGEATRRTPLGAMWAINQYRRGVIDDPKFVDAMVKSAFGTIMMGLAGEAALNGHITGGGPADPKERAEKEATGWQPYSLKVGSQYLNYQRIEPFSTLLGSAADMVEAWQRKDLDTPSDLMTKGVQSITTNYTNKSFLAGLENFLKIVTNPQKDGVNALKQLQASLIPNQIGVFPFGHLTRAIDPEFRETTPFTLEPFESAIPGLSTNLQPQYTPAGEPKLRKGSAVERLLSPFARTSEIDTPVARASEELSRLGVGLSTPPLNFKIGEDKVYFTPEDRALLADARQRALEKVDRLMNSGSYDNLPDQEDPLHPQRRTKRDAIMAVVDAIQGPITQKVKREALQRFQATQ